MNVTRKNIDDLNAVLTVEIHEDDYKEKVEKTLTDYRKTAVIPGFRKGKVPAGLIRKQYGKGLTIEEVNKLIQEGVYNYLNEEKLDVLGNPLPIEQTDIDWDNQKEFAFEFELGLTPEIDVTVPKKTKLDYMKIVADEEMVDEYALDTARRYGKMVTPDHSEAGDMFTGNFVELDAEGNEVEGGINHDGSIMGSTVTDEEALKNILALKIDGSTVIDVKSAFREGFSAANILGTTDSHLNATSGNFRFTLKSVQRLEPHAMDQELFDKVMGEGTVSSEEEFKAKLKEQIESSYVGQSDSDFFQRAHHYFLDNVTFDLPEEFLKKWLRTAGEKPLSAEEVEAQFPDTLKGLRWQLIENRLIKENDIKVEEQELKDYAKSLVASQMMQYGQQMQDEELMKIAENVLQNREEAERINDQIYNQKLVALFKEMFKLNIKEVSIDEFAKHQAEHKR
jgi:trigger factor